MRYECVRPWLVGVVCGLCGLRRFLFLIETVEPLTFSITRTRDASVALVCEAKMNIGRPPVKAVPERVRSRERPPPKETPPQQTATWTGPLKAPVEVDEK